MKKLSISFSCVIVYSGIFAKHNHGVATYVRRSHNPCGTRYECDYEARFFFDLRKLSLSISNMAEAPRDRLPSGYDEEFVDAVGDEILGLICHLPLKEPVLTRCGHRFCKECLEEHFRRCDF